MEDYYHRSKYLSLEKRQTLANQLAIPEQCVSDYFKNLRSKKKHEERMKCLLKGLEHGEKQLDQTDSGDEDEDSMENDTSEHQGLCSLNNSAEQTSSASVEASPQPHGPAQSPSLIQSCGRRFNISPPVSASSQAFQASSERKVSETDLVASKIAALTQGQKSSNRQSGLRNTQSPSARSKDSELQVSRTPTSRSAHRASRESTVPSTRCLSSQTPVSSSEEVETFSLDSLIDGACSSVMLQGGTPETDGLEVGQQIYVVHVNNPAVTSVQN